MIPISNAPSLRHVIPEVPQAKSISKGNIEIAYTSSRGRNQRRRINAVGRFNRNTLKELGAEIREVRR